MTVSVVDGTPVVYWTDGAAAQVIRPAAAAIPAVGNSQVFVADDMAIVGLAGLATNALEQIAKLYRSYELSFIDHLDGPFAIAIWDRRRQRLVCARDHFGQIPAYYFLDNGRFAFSTSRSALMDKAAAQRNVHGAAVAQFLCGRYFEFARTEYEGLYRLPPASVLMANTPSQIEIRPYWRLDPGFAVTARPADRFRELFVEAVGRCPDNTGIMLSGGLDSSAIACTARRAAGPAGNLATFSYSFDENPQWSERPFVESAVRHANFDAHFIPGDNYSAFGDFGEIFNEQDSLYPAMGLPLTRRLYQAASKLGFSVLLDGHGGDEVVSHGLGRLGELAWAKQWRSLWRESRGISRLYGNNAFYVFATHALTASWRLRAIASRARALLSQNDVRATTLIGPYEGLLNRGFLSASGLVDLASNYGGTLYLNGGRSEQSRHARALATPLQMIAFETLHHASRAQGIALRFPFWDRALAEFCVSLPASQKLRGGFSKLILRRAMRGILPEDIRRRQDKLDFSPHAIRSILRTSDASLAEAAIFEDFESVSKFVNIAYVRRAFKRLQKNREKATGLDVRAVWRTTALACWLSHVRRKNASLTDQRRPVTEATSL